MAEGSGANGVLILGEALGATEAHVGTPFVKYADAGAVLERAFKRAGMSREMFKLWNIVGCQPPKNWLEGAPYEHAAIAHCRPALDAIIAEMRPRCILTLGNVPTRALTGLAGDYLGISYLRGYVLPSTYGIPVVPSFHPSFLRRGAMQLFSVLVHDINLAVRVANAGRKLLVEHHDAGWRDSSMAGERWWEPAYDRFVDYRYEHFPVFDPMNPPIPPGYILNPTEEDAHLFLMEVEAHPRRLLTFDIETAYSAITSEEETDELEDTEIESVQFSLAKGTGIFMPRRGLFTEVANAILALGNPKMGANNWRFDEPILEAHGAKFGGPQTHDVRWAFHHIQPELKGNLQFIASFFGWPFPWKHLAQSQRAAYGVFDVDVLQWIAGDCDEILASIAQKW